MRIFPDTGEGPIAIYVPRVVWAIVLIVQRANGNHEEVCGGLFKTYFEANDVLEAIDSYHDAYSESIAPEDIVDEAYVEMLTDSDHHLTDFEIQVGDRDAYGDYYGGLPRAYSEPIQEALSALSEIIDAQRDGEPDARRELDVAVLILQEALASIAHTENFIAETRESLDIGQSL